MLILIAMILVFSTGFYLGRDWEHQFGTPYHQIARKT